MKKFVQFSFIILVNFYFISVIQPVDTETVVAIVNEDVITSSELDLILRPLYVKYSKVYEESELQEKLHEAHTKALDQLIDQKLLSQEAKKQELPIDENEFKKRIRKIKMRFGSEKDFIDALEKDGISLKAFEDKMREQFLIKMLTYKEIGTNISISPKEVSDDYYKNLKKYEEKEMVEMGHILIKKSSHDNALERAQEVQEKLTQDESSFEELAKQYSDDPNSTQGGDMGFYAKGSLMPVLEDKAFSMEVGQVSEMIESDLGYHFIKLKAKRQQRTPPLTEVYEEIYDELFQVKGEVLHREWLNKLREKAHVQIL